MNPLDKNTSLAVDSLSKCACITKHRSPAMHENETSKV